MKLLPAVLLGLLLGVSSGAHASYQMDPGDRIQGQFGSTHTYPFTLVSWIKRSAAEWASVSQKMVVVVNDDTTDANHVHTISTNRGIADTVSVGSTTTAAVYRDLTFADGTYDDDWVVVVAVFTSATSRTICIESSSTCLSDTTNRATNAWSYIALGGQTHTTTLVYNGLMAHAAVFDKALTSGEIDALQTAANTGPPPCTVAPMNCIGYWPLTTNQSSHADESGNSGPTLANVGSPNFSSDNPTITADLEFSVEPNLTATVDGHTVAGTIECTGTCTVYGAAWPPAATAPADCAAVKTHSGALFSANEVWTSGVGNSFPLTEADNPPRTDVYVCGSDGTNDTDVFPFTDQDRSADAGETILELAQTGGAFWNPGNYMLLQGGDDTLAEWMTRCDEIAPDNDVVRGLAPRVDWSVLEPTDDAYDFSDLDDLLACLEANNQHLFALVLDRNFDGDDCTEDTAIPSWVKDIGGTGAGCRNTTQGAVAAIDKPAVMDAEIDLLEELCDYYADEPHFGGFFSAESALSLGTPVPEDYDPSDYVDEIIRRNAAIALRCVTTIFFPALNFPNQSDLMDAAVAALAQAGTLGISGPDVCPSSCPTTAQASYQGVTGGHNYRGEIPAAFMVQPAGVGTKTLEEIYNYSHDDLHNHFTFWTRNTNTTGNGANTRWPLVLAALQMGMYPTFTDCPTNLPNGCVL